MTDLRSDFTSHSGFKFHVRPARPEDEAALGEFFTHVTPEDRRFRFLSSVKEVGHERLVAMIEVDHLQTESFMALSKREAHSSRPPCWPVTSILTLGKSP